MRIGLVGAHGTGKSSLVKAWLEKHSEYYTPPVEESRKVLAKGLGMNFETNPATQEAFRITLKEMIESIKLKKDAITPRTSIDTYVYNLYFFRRPQYGISREFTEASREYTLKALGVWDLFVYCPIMWKLEEESEFRVGQKDNPDYQKEIDDYTYSFLINYNVPHIILTKREDEQRIIEIEKAIEERKG
jgi:hypothetical protein